jgi:Tfp pilus assembly protein FimV
VAALVLALVALVAVVALAVAALDLTGSALGSSAAPAAAAGASTGPVLVVQPGDTLWGIARRLQPRGDVTGLVDHLAALHGSGPLEPGDRLPLAGLPGH